MKTTTTSTNSLGSVGVQIAIDTKSLIFLSVGIFVAVCLGVFVANKLSSI